MIPSLNRLHELLSASAVTAVLVFLTASPASAIQTLIIDKDGQHKMVETDDLSIEEIQAAVLRADAEFSAVHTPAEQRQALRMLEKLRFVYDIRWRIATWKPSQARLPLSPTTSADQTKSVDDHDAAETKEIVERCQQLHEELVDMLEQLPITAADPRAS